MPLFKYPLLSYFECMDAEKSHKKATTLAENGAKNEGSVSASLVRKTFEKSGNCRDSPYAPKYLFSSPANALPCRASSRAIS